MSWVFCDNTVLCNFAAIGRIELLESFLRGRGRWTEAVEYEALQSRGHHPDLGRLIDGGWLGDAIEAAQSEDEMKQIERIRRSVFGGAPEKPTQHLGESETIFLIKNRLEFHGAWWMSDDREAVAYGRAQGLITKQTIDLMADAVAMADTSADVAYELMMGMHDAGRAVTLPANARELIQ